MRSQSSWDNAHEERPFHGHKQPSNKVKSGGPSEARGTVALGSLGEAEL